MLLFINGCYPCNLYYGPGHCYNGRSACPARALGAARAAGGTGEEVEVAACMGDDRRCSSPGSPDRESKSQLNG